MTVTWVTGEGAFTPVFLGQPENGSCFHGCSLFFFNGVSCFCSWCLMLFFFHVFVFVFFHVSHGFFIVV